MDVVLPGIIFALMITVALMFYERSRRDEMARQKSLGRRIAGAPMPTTLPAQPLLGRDSLFRVPYISDLSQPIERWLAEAGLEITVAQYFGVTVMLGAAGLLFTALWLSVGIACFYGAGLMALPAAYVHIRRKQRLATFSQQLPHLADFLRSTLRAGHPLARGLQMAVENAPEPTATELRLAVEKMRYGASLPDALESMFKRVPEESLGFFISAVRVQIQVGSSVAEILDRVADAIRARQRLQQQLKALTAQARMSGLMVGALPYIMLAVFTLIRPEYTSFLFYDPIGRKMLLGAAILDLIGLFVMYRIARV